MQRSLGLLNSPLASTSGRCDVYSLSSGHLQCLGRQHLRLPLQSRSPSGQPPKVWASAQNPAYKAQQAWKNVRYEIDHKASQLKQQFMALPPIVALIHSFQALRTRLQPAMDRLTAWKEAADAWWGIRNERYREFIADETRRKWEWQCRHEDEAAFWTSVVNGIIGIFATVLYEAVTPVSVLIAVVPPLWVAWSLHENILKAPIFWALVAMMPLKFPPFHPFKWII